MLRMLVVFIVVFLGSFSVQAKIIFVGSHGGVDAYANFWELGEVYDPLARHDINEDSSEDKVFSVASDSGVDASIALCRINTSDAIFPLISKDTASVLVGEDYVQRNYLDGDYVFLVGYSAGGKYVINLADELEKEGIPVHFMGLVDPYVGLDITIPKNVKIAEVYIQLVEFPKFMQGFGLFFYDDSETEYHCYTVVAKEGYPTIDHGSIDNEEIVWGNLGGRMLSIVGDSTEFGDDSQTNSVQVFEEDADFVLPEPEVDVVIIQPPSNPYQPTPDLHMTSVKGGLATEEYDDMNHSITETILPGQCVKTSFVARYVNEADQEAKDVDFDWRADQDRSRFDDEDDNLCNENLEDVDAGEKNKKTFNNANLCVSADGTKLTLTGPDNSISSNFQFDEGQIDKVAKLYVFADVEEKGRDNGDHDISDENSSDEYVKIEVVLGSPPQDREVLTNAQKAAAMTVIEMMLK